MPREVDWRILVAAAIMLVVVISYISIRPKECGVGEHLVNVSNGHNMNGRIQELCIKDCLMPTGVEGNKSFLETHECVDSKWVVSK